MTASDVEALTRALTLAGKDDRGASGIAAIIESLFYPGGGGGSPGRRNRRLFAGVDGEIYTAIYRRIVTDPVATAEATAAIDQVVQPSK